MFFLGQVDVTQIHQGIRDIVPTHLTDAVEYFLGLENFTLFR
jgi:hypothetical protein